MIPRNVVMIHDGAIDEFVAEVLLAQAANIALLGVIMVDADCIGDVACDVMWRVNDLANVDVPIGLSQVRAANPFPWEYRSDCLRVADLPMLRQGPPPPWEQPPDGDTLLAHLLDSATGPLTILSTGPVTPLVKALHDNPSRANIIEEVVWMAGAIRAPGNLDPTTIPAVLANPYAEWNVFWDPQGSEDLLRMVDCPITLVPLDASNKLPVDAAFMDRLLDIGHSNEFARFCLGAYGLVAAEPFYRLWDTSTVAWLLEPALFAEPVQENMRVETNPRRDLGALIEDPSGRRLDLILDFAESGATAVSEYILAAISEASPNSGTPSR